LTLSGHEHPFIRARWKANRPHEKTGAHGNPPSLSPDRANTLQSARASEFPTQA